MSGDELRTPEEWCDLRGLQIADPDGWRGRDGRPWTDPITEAEFRRRLIVCTIRYDAAARAYIEAGR